MRLEEWQKFIETQFLEDAEALEKPPGEQNPRAPETQDAEAEPLPGEEAVLLFEERAAPPRMEEPPRETARLRGTEANLPRAFAPLSDLEIEVPALERYLSPASPHPSSEDASGSQAPSEEKSTRRVPRARSRYARNIQSPDSANGLAAAQLRTTIPKHLQTLLALAREEEQAETAQAYYKRPFAEGRRELIARLLDPILTLEETARLLNVCPTTIRRYTNKGILTCYRKEPERSENPNDAKKETRQRRFRLSDILAFLETQQAALETDRQDTRHEREETPSAQKEPPLV